MCSLYRARKLPCNKRLRVEKGVSDMALDMKMLTGIVIGVVLGLEYYRDLTRFFPILVIAVIILLFKTLYHPRVR